MSQARTIVKNVGVLFFSEVVTNALSLLLVFAIARFLGDVGLGQYSFATSFATIFIIFSEFGTLTFLIKEVAADTTKAKRYISNINSMKLIFSVFTLALSIIAIIIFSPSALDVRLVILASLAMFFNYYGYLFRSIFQAFEVMEYDALTKVIERVLTVGLGLFVLWKGYGIEILLATQVLSFMIFFLISWLICSRKVMHIGFSIDMSIWKKILIQSAPFWLTTVFIYIYFKIDTVMLRYLATFAEVGWYNAAYKLMEALSFVQTIIVMAIFPVFSRLSARKETAHMKLLFNKATYYLFTIGLAISIGVSLVAERIIRFIYGAQFEPAIPALKVLMLALFLMFLTFVMAYTLNAVGKGKWVTIVTGVGALINITINLFLIPRFGYLGAAWATVFTECVVIVAYLILVRKIGLSFPWLSFIKPLFAGLCMAVAVILALQYHLFFIMGIGGVVFFSALFLVKGIGKEEIDLVRSTVRMR